MNNNNINEHNSYQVNVNDHSYEISFEEGTDSVFINGEKKSLNIIKEREPDLYSLLLDGKSELMCIEDGNPGGFRVHSGGYDFSLEVVSSREAYLKKFIQASDAGTGESQVKAPMPGLIVKNLVSEGDEVCKDQGVVIMEAMKMENEIKSPKCGKVSKINVKPGEAVDKGAILFEIT